MNRLILAFLLFFTSTLALISQVKIGDNPNTINSNSILEIESTNQGLLVPRIPLTALNNIAPMDAHVQGMTVFNTASSGTFPNQLSPGYYINDGSQWLRLESTSASSSSYGDVKQGFQPIDHTGWYLMDGRVLSDLPPNAQGAAISLGFSGNHPDSRNKFLQHGTTPGATGGASDNLIKIFQTHLPDVNFSGIAEAKGSHSHSVDPPNTSTTSGGNHSHTVDPPNTSTSSGGLHTHIANSANGDVENSSSQGFPAGNSHQSFRSSSRPRVRTLASAAISAAGTHNHTLNIAPFTSSTSGSHAHTINIGSFNSSAVNDNTHPVEVSSGGSGSELDITPEYLSINNFIYLGQ